jgi:SOS-response transcriptional repressor LexA
MAVVATTPSAEYLLVELALPGRPAARVGVLLFDPATDWLRVKFREDLEELAEPEDAEVLAELEGDFALKIAEMGGRRFLEYLEDSLSNVIRISARRETEARSLPWALGQLFNEHILGQVREPARVIPFVTHLPVYSLRAAASRFGEDMEAEAEDQVEAPADLRVAEDMYVVHVVGRSMEPRIPDGALAVFRHQPAGSRQGKAVLVWRRGASEGGGEFTIKIYRSRKRVTEDGWQHEEIVLEPENPEFAPVVLDASADYQVLGEFIRVL